LRLRNGAVNVCREKEVSTAALSHNVRQARLKHRKLRKALRVPRGNTLRVDVDNSDGKLWALLSNHRACRTTDITGTNTANVSDVVWDHDALSSFLPHKDKAQRCNYQGKRERKTGVPRDRNTWSVPCAKSTCASGEQILDPIYVEDARGARNGAAGRVVDACRRVRSTFHRKMGG